MQRLHGRDAHYLFRDTPTNGMHSIKVQIIDPAVDEVSYPTIRQHFESFLRRVPMLRQRVLFVPFGLHHPVLINDPHFDLDMHLHRIALPAPASRRELDMIIGQIASGNLDPSRPLWDVWVVEGLPDGKLAIVQKVHHAMADGMASVGYLTRAYSRELPGSDTEDHWQPDAIPSNTRLMLAALWDHLRQDLLNIPGLLRVLWRRGKALLYRGDRRIAAASNGDAPRTRFNYALSAKRSFASTTLPLTVVDQLRQNWGGEHSDVVLSLVTAGLRDYLENYGELPDRPLLVSLPVAADEKGSTRDFGNNSANMAMLLPVHLADARERHRFIVEVSDSAEKAIDRVGRDTRGRILHYVPPAVWRHISDEQYKQRSADKRGYKVSANLILSLVEAPQTKLGDLTNVYAVGPLLEGTGLNISAWSYCGQLNISALACKRAAPDLYKLTEGIERAVQQLLAEIDQPQHTTLQGEA